VLLCPQVAHAALLMQHCQAWAKGDPLIVAGDFNFKPFDPAYRLLLDGHIPADHAHHPPAPPADRTGRVWEPKFNPTRSAFAAFHGHEPDFTNYATMVWNGKLGAAFCETLDYIFLSPEWRVTGVSSLPSRAELAQSGIKSFPSSAEPSDHLMLRASLLLEG
jgi:endonuclease/exonuclease/phosphatase family metal-dependent hydrolase